MSNFIKPLYFNNKLKSSYYQFLGIQFPLDIICNYVIIILASFTILANLGDVKMVVNSTEIQNNFGRYLMLSIKEVTVYLFKDRDICSCTTFRKTETASSYIFEGLTVELKNIFR